MGGGLMQLVAYGAQDIYLTGNPQITFFKVVYRRHTNFSMESIEQTWNGDPTTGRATATISRNGDLVYRLYLQQTVTVCTPPPKVANRSFDGGGGGCGSSKGSGCCNSDYGPVVYNPGHLVIRHVEVEIGGQRIDHQTGAWMEVWAQLTQENSAAVLGVVGDNSGTKFQNMARGGGCVVLSSQMGKHSVSEAVAWGAREDGKTVDGTSDKQNKSLASQARFTKYDAYVPLQFWFCRNPGLALPLIALQYHEVRIILQINTDFVCGPQYNGSNCQPSACIQDNSLYADYIYLDTDERRRFAQVSHEYLIEQIQHQNFRSNGGSLDLNFNHPVKELIWTGGQSSVTGLFGILPGASADYLMPDFYADCETPGFNATYQLKLNGHDRMSLRPLEYYTKQQVYDYHTGTPVGCGDSYTTQCDQCCMGNLDFLKNRSAVNAPKPVTGSKKDAKQGSRSNYPMGAFSAEIKGDFWEDQSDLKHGSFPQAYYAVGPGQAATAAIAVYSFALKPEEHQPSGTCNFSRIDNAQLVINGYPSQGKSGSSCCCDNYDVYAVNYNVLRIMSGMGGLAYSN